MSTENNTGIQTRAMAQWVDNEANPEQLQRAADPTMNPTVELHRTKEEAIEEFVQQHGTINFDWYVPDLCNTRVSDLIKKRLQLETIEGRILFSSPALSEFFKTSNFELNLRSARSTFQHKPRSPLHPMEVTNTKHPKMTQYCKEKLPPQWTSSRPTQPM